MKKSIKGAGGTKHSQTDIKAPAKKMPTTKDSKSAASRAGVSGMSKSVKKGKKSKFNAGAFAAAKKNHFGMK